jgi:hypothetical protein
MDSAGLGLWLRKCGLIMICLLIALLLPNAASSYNIGVGISDTTGPVAEVVFVSLLLYYANGDRVELNFPRCDT